MRRECEGARPQAAPPLNAFGAAVQFTKHLRDPIKRGEITTSIRIWKRPHVKAGNRYKLDDGFIVVEKISAMQLEDITPQLARESGFAGVVDLLRTAKHGAGENVYLIRFRYEEGPGRR